MEFDFLVIGSGIAGLWYALKVAATGKVGLITKKHRTESNTNYAQGGIAAVMGTDDTFALHIHDTLAAGAGLCREEVVHAIVSEGPGLVRELIAAGVKFSADAGGEYDLGREGGHTRRRVLHAGDITGREIERALLAAVAANPNIRVFEDVLAIDLITTQKLRMPGENRCLGCYALDEKRNVVEVYAAPVTL
ncbi:MAG: FAD-binding protein, partial [Verrucomicrobiota bacterium]